jgi:copper chaperone CopZ
MTTVELAVQGMTCGSCVRHVTKALQGVPGVTLVEVDLASGRALVEGDLQEGVEPLIAALASEDYPAKIADGLATAQSTKSAGCQGGKDGQSGKGGGCCG